MREYGSEHPAIVLPDGYFESLSDLEREIMYLRSGREALLMAGIAACNKKEKIDNDVYYAKNISFALDVKIVLKTVKTVLCRETINVTREEDERIRK